MPWQEVSTMSLRAEFVALAHSGTIGLAELCRRFGISRKTAYKWLSRFDEDDPGCLADHSRKPLSSPRETPSALVRAVLDLRDQHPAWGGRKIRARLLTLGHDTVPATSTVTDILRRHGRIDPAEASKHKPWQRFEHEQPNSLWQMDFKGHFGMRSGRCHPLTVLDDHSRYAICLKACAHEQGSVVQQALTEAFRRYGLPDRMTMDNGSPWGSREEPMQLVAWLIRLGIGVGHSRPCHPQTQGKDERFHRSLDLEVIRGQQFEDLKHCQRHFDAWRHIYNQERPHQAIGLATPQQRYQLSSKAFPETLPAIEYPPGYDVRMVQEKGVMNFRGRKHRIGKAFRGHPIGLRPTINDGLYEVFFCQQKIAEIDLRVTLTED